MAIKTIVTRGFGNGTFSGTIALVVIRGYEQGLAFAAKSRIFVKAARNDTFTPAATGRTFTPAEE